MLTTPSLKNQANIVDDSIRKAADLAKETGWYQATAELNPFVVEAQKTISYEINEQLAIPGWIIVPMGSGGTIYSLWKGFKELKQLGLPNRCLEWLGFRLKAARQ